MLGVATNDLQRAGEATSIRIKHTTCRVRVALATIVLVAGLSGCADMTPAVQRTASASAAAPVAEPAASTTVPASAPAAEGVFDTITVRGGDLFFELAEIPVKAPGRSDVAADPSL
jgi:hypothetical protein